MVDEFSDTTLYLLSYSYVDTELQLEQTQTQRHIVTIIILISIIQTYLIILSDVSELSVLTPESVSETFNHYSSFKFKIFKPCTGGPRYSQFWCLRF